MISETDKILDILYYAKDIERYNNKIRDIAYLINELEDTVAEEELYEKALEILYDNNRAHHLSDIMREQLEHIKNYNEICRTNAIIRLTHTLTDDEENSK